MTTLSPSTLLCEACGYPLVDPALADKCPECGTPADASLPGHRPGSDWQQKPGLAAWWGTNWRTLRAPRARWRELRIESSSSITLGLLNTLAAAIIGGISVLLPGAVMKSADVVYGLEFTGGAFLAIGALTWIELRGIRFFGNRRGWRISRAVADAVCAHASVGWIVAMALLGAGWHIGQVLGLQPLVPWGKMPLNMHPALTNATVLCPAAGFLIGLLVFEVLVYRGMNALRFANPPGARVDGVAQVSMPSP